MLLSCCVINLLAATTTNGEVRSTSHCSHCLMPEYMKRRLILSECISFTKKARKEEMSLKTWTEQTWSKSSSKEWLSHWVTVSEWVSNWLVNVYTSNLQCIYVLVCMWSTLPTAETLFVFYKWILGKSQLSKCQEELLNECWHSDQLPTEWNRQTYDH